MEMATNIQSRGEWRPLSEAAGGVTADDSIELRWTVERIGGGEGFVRS